MSKAKQRNYSTKDVDMLITSATIIDSAIANKDFLISKRSIWADPYFSNLKDRIDTAIQNLLGIDNAKDLRGATYTIKSIQVQAMKDLSAVVIQLKNDFRMNKVRLSELLNILGFTTFYKEVQRRDQESLINLLFRFKLNLSEDLKNEIINAGIESIMLDNVMAHANTLKIADINQETFKGLRKEITEATRIEFNGIYDEVIGVSKIASNFFRDQPIKKEHFSFYKVSKRLNTVDKKIEPDIKEDVISKESN